MNAPRITIQDIENNIVVEHYFNAAEAMAEIYGTERNIYAPLTLMTFCILVLRNGFTVTGESACVSADNYDKAIGEKIARENAINKIWPLMGYSLKQALHTSNLSK
jgi:Phage protein (N4 Gp49/phage Sf6 gene 66) family